MVVSGVHASRAQSGTVAGVEEARRALADGRAAVVPHPAPQAYGVVATAAATVNRVKGRRPEQDVCVMTHDDGVWRAVVPALDLTPEAVAEAYRLLRHDRVSLLLPVRAAARPPAWAAPAIRDGHLLTYGADLGRAGPGWAPLAALWAAFPRLYGSSANVTGRPAAGTAGEARAAFDDDVAVVDGDALRGPGVAGDATAILRMAPDGTTTLARPGSSARGQLS